VEAAELGWPDVAPPPTPDARAEDSPRRPGASNAARESRNRTGRRRERI